MYPKYKSNGIEELIEYNGRFYSLQYYLEHEDEFNYEKTKRIVRTIQGSWMIVNKNGFWNMDFKDAFSSELYNNYGWSDIRERLLKVEKQTPIPPHQNLIDGVV